jgi:hypothetical protein
MELSMFRAGDLSPALPFEARHDIPQAGLDLRHGIELPSGLHAVRALSNSSGPKHP